ncbi:conserved hypothetical protein [Leishmania mexicana MHOM/GT/2001/U1103]|uniref:RRM domain-containing protein n=1 Tax=Leishmania mexicana (strain MHOM/GT/2001/U1103) TaxID=929439 RepID=E9AX02_LEIMU|nr:conserved hypothetical protein [Leishmania mexicana MHOM/GT/2001/U1103]CBZ27488.1 conserved hypothetical protein [Leishmania mexicana MHOM/GT/2001/U1103]
MQPTHTPTQTPQQDPLPDLNTLTSNAFFPFPSAAGAASAASAEAGQQQMATAHLYEASQLESIMRAAAGDGQSAATAPDPAASNLLGRLTVSTLAAQSAAPGTSPQPQPCLVPQFTPLGAGVCSNASRSSAPSYGSASVPIGCGTQMYSGDTSFLYPTFVNEMSSLTPPQSVQGHGESFVAGVTTPPAMPMNSSTISHKGGSMNDNTSTSLSQAASSGIAASSGQPNDAEVRSNLFVCGLPVSVRDKELLELFEKHGEIESAKVMLDIHTGRSRGIAFVKFKNVENAENAVDALNGTTVNGHQITVRVANSRAAYLPGNPTNKTFVRNVPLTVSRTTLFEYFAQFGEVTDLSIKSDTAQGRHNLSGRSTSTTEDGADDKLNIVFITYSTKEAAAKAAEATHTKTPFKECNGVPLLAKVAEDTVRRMERLSRRQRPAAGAEGTREVSTSSSSTNVASMSRFAAPSMGAALPTGMMMSPMMPMTGGFSPGTFVSVPTLGNASDLTAPTMMPASVAGDHMTALRDASGNPIYAPAQPNPAAAAGGMAYAMPGNMTQHSIFFSAQPPPPMINQPPPQQPQPQPQPQQQPQPQLQAQPQTLYISTPNGFVSAPQQQQPQQSQQPLQFFSAPPLLPQAPQQSQQAMPMAGAAPGQLVYMQTPSGSMVPVMYGGAQPAAASMLPTQQMNPYFVMMGGQPPSNQ